MKYTSSNKPLECMMTQSSCYKGTKQMNIVGVLWHSTGANNKTLKRYVQPDDNAKNKAELLKKIGTNAYKNDYNHTAKDVGLNAWIGTLADGTVAAVQTMPWNYRPWGCGSGSKGSCNNGWIQFEICEDNLKDKAYFDKIFEEAAQLTAYLCKLYNINPNGTVIMNGVKVPTILCHSDSHKLGLGSNHSDIYPWFSKYGKDMVSARSRVTAILNEANKPAPAPTTTTSLKVGDLVAIDKNAVYYNGKAIPDWVKKDQWYISSIGKNGRVVIDKNKSKNNSIMSAIDAKYLKLVSTASTGSSFKSYKVKVTASALNCRDGAGTKYKVNVVVKKDEVYTIIEEKKDSTGQLWGKLKSGAGWILLKYTSKV